MYRRFLILLALAALLSGITQAQTVTVIPANEAAHINEWTTVEGVVAKMFTSNKGNKHFFDIGATYPNRTFTGWMPLASPINKSLMLSGIEENGSNHLPNRNVQREAGNSDQCRLSVGGPMRCPARIVVGLPCGSALRIWGYVLKAISTDCPHLAARFPAERAEPSVEQKPCCFQDFHWHRVGRFEFHCPAVVHFASAAANRPRNTPARITFNLVGNLHLP